MTKLLFIILLIPSICFSQIKGYIELGHDIYNDASFTEWQLGYNFNIFDFRIMPYGNQITWLEFNSNSGDPFCGVYTIGTEIQYEKVVFDFQHFCSHTIKSTQEVNRRYYDSPIAHQSTTISARYEF